ncbi:MAG: AtpZ/AtpI family protein [Bacteroidota bacterium]
MPKHKASNDYLRYAGLGFEILACILLFVGAGYRLDQWLETEKPWFTLFLSLCGCAMAIYLMIRQLNRPKPPRDPKAKQP